jgi:hypothetical protein
MKQRSLRVRLLDRARLPIFSLIGWLVAAVAALAASSAWAQGDARAPGVPDPASFDVSQKQLIEELVDLRRLMLPLAAGPRYRVVQFSSYDRRSTTRDEPHWYANADGFGKEPVPGFAQVLEEPDRDGHGLFLICDVQQPGVIVRTWSAGMGGELCVELDGREIYRGDARAFWSKRSDRWFPVLRAEIRRWLVQEDADYLPMPFGKRLRITWRGSLRKLHFYALQLRLYEPGTQVQSFRPIDLNIERILTEFAERRSPMRGVSVDEYLRRKMGESTFRLEPGQPHEVTVGLSEDAARHPDRLHFLSSLRVMTAPVTAEGKELSWPDASSLANADRDQRILDSGWRRTLLQVFEGDAQEPLVEAPLGDFFGTGIGTATLRTAAWSVERGGLRGSRFPMPYREPLRIRLTHFGEQAQSMLLSWHRDWMSWDVEAMGGEPLRFRARWRVDHALHARGGAEPIDLPYLVAIGQGRLVGVACMLMNPLPTPLRGSNWWGEGDEKIFVDGAGRPALFGTGSEDYFNYSWSHWRYFDYPYCGQPLDTGPGNCGYVSNHRLHVLDDVPFENSLAFYMELWSHVPVEPLSYGRIAYWYGAKGAIDDHRRLQPSDLRVPELPRWPQSVWSKEGESTLQSAARLGATASGGKLGTHAHRLSRCEEILTWEGMAEGDELTLPLHAAGKGRYALRLVMLHEHRAAVLEAELGGKSLRFGGKEQFAPRDGDQERLLEIGSELFTPKLGENALVLRCVEPGPVGIAFVHMHLRERPPLQLTDFVEAEDMKVLDFSKGLDFERQGMRRDRWSGGRHLWVKATQTGQRIVLELPVSEPGEYELALRLTASWDYGVLQVKLGDRVVAERVDTFNSKGHSVAVLPELKLGKHHLDGAQRLTLEVIDRHPDAGAPGYYFGLDGVHLRKLDGAKK